MSQFTYSRAPPKASDFPLTIQSSQVMDYPRTIEVDNGSALTVSVFGDNQLIRTLAPYTTRFNLNVAGWTQLRIEVNTATIQATDVLTIIAYDQVVVPPLPPSFGVSSWGAGAVPNSLGTVNPGNSILAWQVQQLVNLLTGVMTGQPVTIANTMTLPNGAAYQAKDTGGTAQPILFLDGSNNLQMGKGTAAGVFSFRSFAGPTVVKINDNGNITLLNNIALQANDSGGVARPVLILDTSNNLALRKGSAAGSFQFINWAGTTVASITDAGNIILLNGSALQANDSGGTAQSILFLDGSNNLQMGKGTAAGVFSFRNFAGSTVVKINDNGNITLLNNIALQANDSGGVARPVLILDASNNLALRKGSAAGSFQFINWAGTTVASITDAGKATMVVAAVGTASNGITIQVEGTNTVLRMINNSTIIPFFIDASGNITVNQRVSGSAVGASAKTWLNFVPFTAAGGTNTVSGTGDVSTPTNLAINNAPASAVALCLALSVTAGPANEEVDFIGTGSVGTTLAVVRPTATINGQGQGIVSSSGATIKYEVLGTGGGAWTFTSQLVGWFEPS